MKGRWREVKTTQPPVGDRRLSLDNHPARPHNLK